MTLPPWFIVLALALGGTIGFVLTGTGLVPPAFLSENARNYSGGRATTTPPVLFDFIEIIGGCGPHYEGDCAVARSGLASTSPIAAQLRPGMVLKVADTVETGEGRWYKIAFDEWIRYPDRINGDWYVAESDKVRITREPGEMVLPEDSLASTTKRILVDRSAQTLDAYDGQQLFMHASVSTGLALTPTPRGVFSVYKKTPARYMQGPLPGISDQYYDLPGVPWNLYFTYQGGVIHGAYWHDSFGQPWSHGCVNLSPENARVLYEWADIGTPVIVED